MSDALARLGIAPGGLAGLAIGPDARAAVALAGHPAVIVPTSDLAAVDTQGVRWVWWSKDTAAALVRSAIRPKRCWDLTAVHRLVSGTWRADPGARLGIGVRSRRGDDSRAAAGRPLHPSRRWRRSRRPGRARTDISARSGPRGPGPTPTTASSDGPNSRSTCRSARSRCSDRSTANLTPVRREHRGDHA